MSNTNIKSINITTEQGNFNFSNATEAFNFERLNMEVIVEKYTINYEGNTPSVNFSGVNASYELSCFLGECEEVSTGWTE